MGKVVFNMSMSLDGFVAGANDGPEHPLGEGGEPIFQWYDSGDVDYKWPGNEMTSKISAASVKRLDQAIQKAGALITGRKTFDIANAWGGHHPANVPVVVLTHRIPQEWMNRADSPFTFVTDGIESAVRQAKGIAGEKDVIIGTAQTLQQALQAGLVDEITIDLAPFVLGKGVRLFEHFGKMPLQLEQISAIAGQGVTHLQYRVVR